MESQKSNMTNLKRLPINIPGFIQFSKILIPKTFKSLFYNFCTEYFLGYSDFETQVVDKLRFYLLCSHFSSVNGANSFETLTSTNIFNGRSKQNFETGMTMNRDCKRRCCSRCLFYRF